MDRHRIVCYVCQEAQRDRWTYRNHLLRVHGQVIRGGTSTPIRLEGQELIDAWWVDRAHMCDASNRREVMGLPQVTIQEAARRRHDNRERRERRSRAVARARAYIQDRAARQRAARPSSPPPRRRHSRVTSRPTTVGTQTEGRPIIQAGQQQTHRHESPAAHKNTPCGRCLNCPCGQPENLSRAQTDYPPLRGSRSTSRHRTPSPEPPQLSLEEPTDDTMSQGSHGSPVNFLDPATCDAILEGLRDTVGSLPDFTGGPTGTPLQH